VELRAPVAPGGRVTVEVATPAAPERDAPLDQEIDSRGRAGAPTPEPSPDTDRDDGRARTLRLSHLTAGFFALALAATLANDPGAYVADARFEHYWGASQFLERHVELWDASRTLGRPTQFFSPAIGAVLAVLDVIGTPPWLVERLVHAGYLTLAGIGAVQVLRLFRRRLGVEHVLCGLLFMFNPYTTQFLLPSGLFLHYALAPWFVVAAARGMRERGRRWRWAAVFALGVFSLGALNTASLLYAMLPVVPVVAYLLAVERDRRARDLLAWAWRAALLSAGATAAASLVLVGSARIVAENLATTELPATVASRSSWTESWRGLGSWLTYFFRSGGEPLRSESLPFLFEPVVVVSTFVLPVVALLVLWRSRWRPRLCFGLLAVTGLVVMVGIHPPAEPPPLGATGATLMDELLFARSFRNTYKAGAALMLGIAPLVAVGVVDAGRRLHQRAGRNAAGGGDQRAARRQRAFTTGGAAAVAVVLLSASFPFWTGRLYPAEDRMTDVPTYWRDALAWLDAQEVDGSVLVLPGVNRARYRWGYPGDDIFDAFLDRQHAVRSSLPQGTPEIADLLAALDDRVVGGRYDHGTISRLATLVGVRWVVLRNDLEWESLNLPRPAELDRVRSDPDLELVRTFGAPGENVIVGTDDPPADRAERGLPPVEVYDTGVDGSPAVLVPDVPPLLVAGDGEGLVNLAAEGLVDDSRRTRFTAPLDGDELTDELAAGATLVITDSNRRRVERVTTARNISTETLPADLEGRARPPGSLFDQPGAQSVSTYGEAEDVSASSYGPLLFPSAPWSRPANAFDGSSSTVWAAAPVDGRAWLRVRFAEPALIETLSIEPALTPADGRRATTAGIWLDGELAGSVALTGVRPSEARLPEPVAVSELTIELGGLQGEGTNPVGLAEVIVPGVDLAPRVQMPDDVHRVSEGDPVLAAAVRDAPLVYLMRRQSASVIDEVDLRRRFHVSGTRALVVTGRVELERDTPVETVAAVTAAADGRCADLLAVDGRSVPVRLAPGDPTSVGGVSFAGCEPVVLSDGWHELTTTAGDERAVSTVVLASADTAAPTAPEVRPVEGFGRQGGEVEIDARDGAYLLFRQGFAPGWTATIDGDTERASPTSTVNGWQLAPGRHRVSIDYAPQGLYLVALTASLVVVAGCVVLAVGVGMPGRRAARPRDERDG
jgi:arabinofuranan 3-O-arabinosyltransferase